LLSISSVFIRILKVKNSNNSSWENHTPNGVQVNGSHAELIFEQARASTREDNAPGNRCSCSHSLRLAGSVRAYTQHHGFEPVFANRPVLCNTPESCLFRSFSQAFSLIILQFFATFVQSCKQHQRLTEQTLGQPTPSRLCSLLKIRGSLRKTPHTGTKCPGIVSLFGSRSRTVCPIQFRL